LRKAQLISTEIEIVPVPRNAGYSENPGATQIVNDELKSFILTKSLAIDD